MKNKRSITTIILLINAFILIIAMQAWNQKKEPSELIENDVAQITILQTADIHAQLQTHDEFFWENDSIIFRKRGGLDRIKTLFEQVRKENPEGTIILDGGDMIQGGAIGTLSQGAAFPPIIAAMGYDIIIPGNWEVIYGKRAMMEVMNGYNTSVICANMYDSASNDYLFPPYYIKEVKGVKIAFIGYNDPKVPVRQNPEFSHGIIFRQIEENLPVLIEELKGEHHVDVIFLVTHLGIAKQHYLAQQEWAQDVDYILGNDTHERIRTPLAAKYAKVTEPGAFGSFVGRLDIFVKDGQIVRDSYELMDVDPEKYTSDPEVAQLIEKAREPYVAEIERVLGYTTTPLYRYMVVENPMDNLITDAARWKTGADISFSNGFRFAPPLVPDASGKAAITKEYLWSMLPVNTNIKTGKATGKQIMEWLEQELENVFAKDPMNRFGGWLVRFSGMEIKFDSGKDEGARLISVKVNGKPIQPDKVYTISACFREGDTEDMLCRMKGLTDTEIKDYTVHDVLEEYLKFKGTVAPVRDGRAVAVDLGRNTLSQLPGTDYIFR